MKKFLQFSIGAFLLLSGISLFIFSIQPAYGEEEKKETATDNAEHVIVRYVNIDTINAYYIPYVELSNSAGGSMEELFASYQENAQNLQNRYTKLQERVNMGTISTDEAMKEETAINEGMDHLKRQETEIAYLEATALAKNDSISAGIALYFDNYSKLHHIDYVLMYGTGMPIIYANDSMDITEEVLADLNAACLEKKKATEQKKK